MMFRFMFKFASLNRICGGIIRKRIHQKICTLHPELEEGFNNQINVEFFASYTYLAMANFFAKQNICLLGCHKLFMGNVVEETEHAHKLIHYLNKRGSNVVLRSIAAPSNQCWDSPLAAFKEALELEKCVSEKIFRLLKLSDELCDVSASTLLETEFVETQVEEFNKISRYVSQLEKIGPDCVGIFIFDRYLQKENK